MNPFPPLQNSLGALEADVRRLLSEWDAAGRTAALWNRDARLWTDRGEADWLGWLDTVPRQAATLSTLLSERNAIYAEGFRQAVVLGMGGSSLAPEVWKRTFGGTAVQPIELFVLDSTVPAQIRTLEARLDLAATLFIVASKSGSTIEPNSFMAYFYDRVQALGKGPAGRQFLAITDPGTKMEQAARDAGFRSLFFGDPSIGGRFSALSAFGIVPLAILGGPAQELLRRAAEMVRACGPGTPTDRNPGIELGTILAAAARAGRDKLTLHFSPGIAGLGAWLEQLIAESTGKLEKGIVPIDGEPLGTPSEYGADRLFVYGRLASAPCAEQDRQIEALRQAGLPVVQIDVASAVELGAEMFRWEVATACVGAWLKINPFDQPDVESAKVAARDLMAAFEKQGGLPESEPLLKSGSLAFYADAANAAAIRDEAGSALGLLQAHLNRLRPGDYFAVNAYVEMNAAHEGLLRELRGLVRKRRRVATTVGFGPRFLHSTGQLHKGGPNRGLFLQLTAGDPADLPIPGKPYSFGVLKNAQAAGDFQVLCDRERRIVRVDLGSDPSAGLQELLALIRAAAA